MLPPFFSLYRCIFFFIHAIQRQHDPADKGLFCGGKVRCAVVFLGNLADETDAVAVVAGVAFGGFQVWIILQYIAGRRVLYGENKVVFLGFRIEKNPWVRGFPGCLKGIIHDIIDQRKQIFCAVWKLFWHADMYLNGNVMSFDLGKLSIDNYIKIVVPGSHKLFRCGNILKHILQFLVQCLVILLLQKCFHKEQFSLVFVPEKTDLLGHFFKFKNIIAIAVFDFLLK